MKNSKQRHSPLELLAEWKDIRISREKNLLILENSFTEMNDVAITYGETGHGTKLLIARETGNDTDFVDILAIYNGYFIEFNMSPNPKAANQTLSDEQIQICIDFLTAVQFAAVE